MKKTLTAIITAVLLLGLCTACVSTEVATEPAVAETHAFVTDFTQLIVFGDSSVDTGRTAKLSREYIATGNAPEGVEVFPNEDFFWEGHWSNGKMYPEFLAEDMGLELVNYACGGANSGYGSHHAWLDEYHNIGTLAQVDDYLADCGGKANPNALYFIVTGWNDASQIDYTFDDPAGNPFTTDISQNEEALAAAKVVSDQTGANIAECIDRLAAAGAKKFAVLKLIPAPNAIYIDPNVLYARFLSGCNEAMVEKGNAVAEARSVEILWLDETEQTLDIANNPEKYGFADIYSPYLIKYDDELGNHHYKVTFEHNPDELYQWEDHYTTKAQRITADYLLPQMQDFIAK